MIRKRPFAGLILWTAAAAVIAVMAMPMVEAAHPNLKIAFVGSSFGNEAGDDLPLDIPGATVARISAAAFNADSPATLRTKYDVLVFTWATTSTLNADWATRLVPYMNLGGGVIFEDDGNPGDLAPGVTAFSAGGGSSVVSAVVPGLTDGIVNSFVNNHLRFTAWDPALSPFLMRGANVTGLQGPIGAGCIVLTGPDQDFHGSRGAEPRWQPVQSIVERR